MPGCWQAAGGGQASSGQTPVPGKGPGLVPGQSNRLQVVKSRGEKAEPSRELTRPFAVPPHRLRPLPSHRRDVGGEARKVRGNVGVELGLVDEVGDLPCAPTLGFWPLLERNFPRPDLS